MYPWVFEANAQLVRFGVSQFGDHFCLGNQSGAWKNEEYPISTALIYNGGRSRFATEIGENQN